MSGPVTIRDSAQALKNKILRAYRLLDPTNLPLRLRISMRRRGDASRIYFVAHNRNHVRLFADAAALLGKAGVDCTFVELDASKNGGGVARPELEAKGLSSIDLRELTDSVRPGDVLVTGNDYGPQIFRRFIDSINRGPVTVVGMIEGARALRPHRYRRSDHVLAIGPAAKGHFDTPVHVVGSPVIERSVERVMGKRLPGDYVLINFKGKIESEHDAGALDAAVRACEQLGLRYVISVHPTMASQVRRSHVSAVDFPDLLPAALALISRPSTTVYESLACGIPVVLWPPVSPLAEFSEPLGAFRITRSETELVSDLEAAVAARPRFPQSGSAFLDQNLSILPDRPASRRIADVLLELARSA